VLLLLPVLLLLALELLLQEGCVYHGIVDDPVEIRDAPYRLQNPVNSDTHRKVLVYSKYTLCAGTAFEAMICEHST
jgi:hypothetical protein